MHGKKTGVFPLVGGKLCPWRLTLTLGCRQDAPLHVIHGTPGAGVWEPGNQKGPNSRIRCFNMQAIHCKKTDLSQRMGGNLWSWEPLITHGSSQPSPLPLMPVGVVSASLLKRTNHHPTNKNQIVHIKIHMWFKFQPIWTRGTQTASCGVRRCDLRVLR